MMKHSACVAKQQMTGAKPVMTSGKRGSMRKGRKGMKKA